VGSGAGAGAPGEGLQNAEVFHVEHFVVIILYVQQCMF
jgi:hypothetical protein